MADSHASEAKISSTFRVGRRWTCTMTADLDAWPLRLECRWLPEMPRRLRQSELDDYRRGRDVLACEIARILGGPALVVEPVSTAVRVTVASSQPAAGRA